MSKELTVGMTHKEERIVTKEVTASYVGSGSIDVYATPSMVALMEQAAAQCVQPYLPEGYATVGTSINISHIAATPVGMRVYAQAELIEIDNRRLVFRVEAFDETGKIGEGTHDRFIIDVKRFMEKVQKKGK